MDINKKCTSQDFEMKVLIVNLAFINNVLDHLDNVLDILIHTSEHAFDELIDIFLGLG